MSAAMRTRRALSVNQRRLTTGAAVSVGLEVRQPIDTCRSVLALAGAFQPKFAAASAAGIRSNSWEKF
jgi:hypothetical protein